MRGSFVIAWAALVLACSSPSGEQDAGVADAGVADAGPADGSEIDEVLDER